MFWSHVWQPRGLKPKSTQLYTDCVMRCGLDGHNQWLWQRFIVKAVDLITALTTNIEKTNPKPPVSHLTAALMSLSDTGASGAYTFGQSVTCHLSVFLWSLIAVKENILSYITDCVTHLCFTNNQQEWIMNQKCLKFQHTAFQEYL